MFNLGENSMKKTLVAIAALAASVGAMAQSSVTLFGVVDATYAYGKGDVAKKTQLTNSGLNSSRLGFKGTEDLGGGMKASFWLEAGVNNDDGTLAGSSTNNQAVGAFNATTGANAASVRPGTQGLTFNRRSTVSLGGNMGEARLGRDYTPHFWNQTVYDVFGTNGVGTTQTLNSSLGGPTTVRASNSIGYLTPGGLGGFSGQIQYYMGENASNVANSKDGSGISLRAAYDNGPISAAFGYGKTKYAAGNTVVGSPAGDIATTNFGASYDLGVVKLSGLYDQDKVTNGATGKGFNIGLTAPVGPGEIRTAFSTYKTDAAGTPKTNKFAVGYVYNVSKRTAVYTTFAHVSNKGGATQALNGATTSANGSSNGLDIGLRHSF
jgi:predicted porin